jgi:hypothetical protein
MYHEHGDTPDCDRWLSWLNIENGAGVQASKQNHSVVSALLIVISRTYSGLSIAGISNEYLSWASRFLFRRSVLD